MRGGQPEYVPGQCTDGNPSQPSSLPDPSSPSDPSQPSDTEAPVITLNGLNPTEIEINSVYSDMGATVTDNKDQNLGYKVSLDGGSEIDISQLVLDTTIPGEHTITF